MVPESEFAHDDPRVIDEPASWLEKNQSTVGAIAVLVFLAVAAGVWWWQGRQAAAEEACNQLVHASEPTAWKKILQTHADTPAAPLALMRLAGAAREKSDWNEALAYTDQFLRDYRSHSFYPLMQLSRAETLEAAGRLDEALQAYELVHNAKPTHPLLGGAVLGMARIHLAKKETTAARTVLSDYLATGRAGAYAAEVSQKLKALPAPETAPVMLDTPKP
ncbi:MAG: hypothetical protein SFU85_02185 [Candidatus Methylacidiphilales bacterium]|nr:hypothetical protein [Candidatus Methylacidiphilales bacterium]